MFTAIKKTALVFGLIFIAHFSQAQLIITPNANATQLAQQLVGTGITISNATFTGNSISAGFFKNVSGTNINLDSGIVITTGAAQTTGVNTGMNGNESLFASTSHGAPGDAQLQAYLNSINPSNNFTLNDAAFLEFDFVPIGDTVRFRYVFGSEEYPTFACTSFNDIFAFFISGPGITGTKNIALIPNTNIPVAINSINGGSSSDINGLCAGMGPGSPFVNYFVNNQFNPQFTYGGHTTVLIAESVVVPCQTYHLKLAIADVGDGSYDSGVLLQARSLTSSPLKIVNQNPTTAAGVPYVIEGCTAGSIKISRQKAFSFAQPVNLAYTGTAVNGVDIQIMPTSVTIPANDSVVVIPINPLPDNVIEGNETFKVYVTFGACGSASGFYADSISIIVRDQLAGTATVNATTCANNTGSIALSVPAGNGNTPYTYSINGGAFQSGSTFNGLPTGQTLVTIKDSNGCVHNIVTTVGLNNNLTLSVAPSDTSLCIGASFTPRVTSAATSYSWSPSAGINTPTVAQPSIKVSNSGVYTLSAYQGPCVVTRSINVTTFQGPAVSAGPDLAVVAGSQVMLQATGTAGSTYVWSPATGLSSSTALNPMASPSQTTTYTLTATSNRGCTSSDDVLVSVLNCFDPKNAFTPNGDGQNDTWSVNLGDCIRKARVEVFNRYGARVFMSDNYKNDWNGTFEGKPLPDATYYYVITMELVTGQKTYHKGNVTILR